MREAARQDTLKALETLVREKLLAQGVISGAQAVVLRPCHPFSLRGKQRFHFLIQCSPSGQIFFLKTVKDADGTLLCDEFLRKAYVGEQDCPYPLVLVPEFEALGNRYYITTFLEGFDLDRLPPGTTERDWMRFADRLLPRLRELEHIHAAQYSECSGFHSESCGTVLARKLRERARHPFLSCFPREQVTAAVNEYAAVLSRSIYSSPTLLHMDIKPANIIYDPRTESISIIDFELARFSDLDYGRIQILLSGINSFAPAYRQILVPRLTREYPSLEEAEKIPKLQCYLFYQCLCNLIYYYDHALPCPEQISVLFDRLLNQF